MRYGADFGELSSSFLKYLCGMRLGRLSMWPVFSSALLLATWLGVFGLEVTHQLGHLFAGCGHHEHHGVHLDHHAGCNTWDGPHEDVEFDQHLHMCEMCDWRWLPLGESPKKKHPKSCPDWQLLLTIGEHESTGVESQKIRAHGRRGPPARG